MNGPELLVKVMIRELKNKGDAEEKLADAAYAEMNRIGSGPKAAEASETMKKHLYAAQEFRKMAKAMEEKQ